MARAGPKRPHRTRGFRLPSTLLMSSILSLVLRDEMRVGQKEWSMRSGIFTRVCCVIVSMWLATTTGKGAQVRSSGDEAPDVRKSVQAFYDAYNAHEFDKLTQFTTEDWTHIAPNGIVRKGRPEVLQALTQTHATFLKGVTDTPEEVDVRLATPSVAVVTVRSRSSTFTTPDGVTHENESRIRTFVVVSRNGRWLIMQDQNTVANQPATGRRPQ